MKDNFAFARQRFVNDCAIKFPRRVLLTAPIMSGKTTFCRQLMEAVPDATLVVARYPRGPREIGTGAICGRQFGPIVIDDVCGYSCKHCGPHCPAAQWVEGHLLARVKPLSPILWVQSRVGPCDAFSHRAFSRWERMRIPAQKKNGKPIFDHLTIKHLAMRRAQLGDIVFEAVCQGRIR